MARHGADRALIGRFMGRANQALFVCPAMVQASWRFMQQRASACTLVKCALLGLASGLTMATALAARAAAPLVATHGVLAL